MDSRLLDVLHDPADQAVIAVRHPVHIELERVLEEPVEQNRLAVRRLRRLEEEAPHAVLVEHDLHRATAEHVRWPHQDRVADASGHRQRVLDRVRRPEVRTVYPVTVKSHPETPAVLGEIDRLPSRAEYGYPGDLEL
jgi:hypothetical protein